MRPFAAATLVCVALALFHTWPIASAPGRLSLNHNADAELNAWIVSWIAYALTHEPRHLFAGNIFQPDDRAIAYSEPLFVPALAGAPIRWLGGSAVLTFNVLLVAGLAATALTGWWVVLRWTGSFAAGLVAGALTAFNTHLLTRLPHLQAAHAWGLVLVIYFTDRLLVAAARPDSRRSTALLAIVLAAVAMTSEYWLFFAGVAILVLVAGGARSSRVFGQVALACAIGVLIALPVLLPYLRLAAEGVRRPIEQAAQFSATLPGYLVSKSRLDFPWGRRFFTSDVNVFFPGVAALALATVGGWSAVTAGGPARRRAVALMVMALVGLVFSLGPATPIYIWAYRVVVPLQGLRAAARFGFLPLLAVALLAGYGVAAIERYLKHGPAAVLFGVLALAAVSAEAWSGPIFTTPFTGVPPIYAQLDKMNSPIMLAEVPFWPAEALFENGEYVLNATAHRAPIMNGYSGYTPDSYRRRAAAFWFFPEAWAIAAMRREGVTDVMVHLERFGPEAAGVIAVLDTQHELRLVSADDLGHRLYRFTPTVERDK